MKTLITFLAIFFVSGCTSTNLPIPEQELQNIRIREHPAPANPKGYTLTELAIMFNNEASDNCANVEARLIANMLLLGNAKKVKIPQAYITRCVEVTE